MSRSDSTAIFFKRQGISLVETQKVAVDFQNELLVADIVVGERQRRDMGDIAALAANMDELELWQPIVIRPDSMLIASKRRLRTAELLGWTTISVSVVGLEAVIRGEFAENTCRKDFSS